MPSSISRQPAAAPNTPGRRRGGARAAGSSWASATQIIIPAQQNQRQQRARRFGQPRHERRQHAFGTAVGGVGKRHRHGKALGDIVQCDGQRRAQPQGRVCRTGEEGQHPLGEIVQQQCRAGDEGCAHGLGAGSVLTVFLRQLGFLGQQAAQQSGGKHAEGQQHYDGCAAGQRRQVAAVKAQGFGQQVRQRCGEHDAARETSADRQSCFGWFCRHGQQAAQCGGQTCQGGKYHR